MDQKMIEKYNPDKFRELNQKDIEAMRAFTQTDVAALAKAYPNKPSGRAYLVLFDTTDKARQLYPLSTWQNLLALWKQQLTKYVAWNYAGLHNNKAAIQGATKTGPIQDLTQAEVTRAIKSIPGKIEQPTVARTQTPAVVDSVDESDSDYTDADFEKELEEAEAKTKADRKRKTAPAKKEQPMKTVPLTRTADQAKKEPKSKAKS